MNKVLKSGFYALVITGIIITGMFAIVLGFLYSLEYFLDLYSSYGFGLNASILMSLATVLGSALFIGVFFSFMNQKEN